MLVLLRHGESVWNRERRFAGWSDVPLTAQGIRQATRAGEWLAGQGCIFDRCFTSQLSRAIDTASLVLRAMGVDAVPTTGCWQLNERHYGAAQGLTWWQAVLRYGPMRVVAWRRDHDAAPPVLSPTDPRHPAHDAHYTDVIAEHLPASESLNQLRARVVCYWEAGIVPELHAGRSVLIVAHRNVLRALAHHLGISGVTFATGHPLLIELDGALRVRRYVVLPCSGRG